MAIYKEDIVDVNLDTGTVHRSFANKMIGEGDKKGDCFGVRCIKNGQLLSLSGSIVIGHFIKPDGTTVEMYGEIKNGDTAVVVLPESCYAIEGNFSLAIKVSNAGGQNIATLRMVDGTIINTTDGAVIDPGSVVPDLSDMTEMVERAEAAVEIILAFSITAEQIDDTDYKIVIQTYEEG